MSNCSASCTSVRSPLIAAIATFALKADVWFRRGLLLMLSPDSRANLARCQAEAPLIALCRFPKPALSSIFFLTYFLTYFLTCNYNYGYDDDGQERGKRVPAGGLRRPDRGSAGRGRGTPPHEPIPPLPVSQCHRSGQISAAATPKPEYIG